MSRAHELDPLSRQIGVEWGWVTYLMHRNDEAAAHIQQALELDPNYAQGYFRLGLVRTQQRRYPEAIQLFKRSIDLGVFYPYGAAGLAFAYAVSGDRAAAIRIVNDLKRRAARELRHPLPTLPAQGFLLCSVVFSADNEGMADHVYKKIEIVGSSPNGFEEAVQNALARAKKTVRNMRWFEVTESRG